MSHDDWSAVLVGLLFGGAAVLVMVAIVWVYDRLRERKDARYVESFMRERGLL